MRIFNKIVNRLFSVTVAVSILASCSDKLHEARFVLLPDTQTYAEKYPHILDSQINWIIRNAKETDIVLQQGDLTQNNNEKEWTIVKSAFYKLNGLVPYVLAVGNHDMGSGPGKFADVRNSMLFNSFFPYKDMSRLPAFGGVFESEKMDNAYYLMETGKHKWMVLTLEFGPRDTVLAWANKLVAEHPDRTVILNTHCYMYSDSTRQTGKDYWRPQAYGIGKDTGANAVNDGEEIWEKLVRKHHNIRFVFSGHVLNSGLGNLVSINNAGFPVYQFLANYQEGVKGSVNGGNGYLRLLRINFKKNNLSVRTYSPYSGEFLKDDGQDFEINHVILK